MYRLINKNIDLLLDTINYDKDILPYIWLVRNLACTNVAKNTEYQRLYRVYWQLNAARLSEDFCKIYFTLLEKVKLTSTISVETVARQLLAAPSHGNGVMALQFSFASKLVHMANHQLPVYDKMVADFYFLPSGPSKEENKDKLNRLLISYEFLVGEYSRILKNNFLGHCIERFHQKFNLGSEYSDIKVIDTIIWKFVSMLRRGAVRDKNVVYSR